MPELVKVCAKISDAAWFQRFIVTVIIINGVVIGMETYPYLKQHYGDVLYAVDRICLGIFVIEIGVKMLGCWPRPWRFFHNGWNVFDFIIVAGALMPGIESQATVLRLVRLLRVLRLLSSLPGLQILVLALLRAIPSIGQMAMLAGLLFYVYAIVGTTLFERHDPEHWGSLHVALLSLFRILTLEDWTDLMYSGIELYAWSWVYFVSFVLFATFIVFNMLIGVILNSMTDAKEIVEREKRAMEAAQLGDKIKAVRKELDHLEVLLEQELKRRPPP